MKPFIGFITLFAMSAFAATYPSYQYIYADRSGTPVWEISRAMPHDIFTFVRIKYNSWGSRGNNRWAIDTPDADINLSFRLQQLTSLKTATEGLVLELTDPRLFDYPFIYMVEPGRLEFTDEEVPILRKYLLNGGFLMMDDNWGLDEYENFHQQLKRVFPEDKYEPQELPLEHPIFHCVFDLKEKPQVPGIGWAQRGYHYEPRPNTPEDDGSQVMFKGIFDDKGRMMVIICHNTDNGDGWEREGDDVNYFKEYSEPKAYPIGINIIYYCMTH